MVKMNLSYDILKSLSSEVDLCEPNYTQSLYIAEMWNTLSSLSMVVISLVMMNLYKEYASKVPNCHHVNFVWFLLLVVGVGSAFFHSTLSLLGQFLDELSVIVICVASIAFWWPEEMLIKPLRNNRSAYHLLTAVIGVFATSLSFFIPAMNHLLLFVFGISAGRMVICMIRRHKDNQDLHELIRSALNSFLIAFVCWLHDHSLFQFWLNINFPYLHGFWHIMICRASYKFCVALSYCYALSESNPSYLPYLKYQHLSINRNLGLWSVGFRHQRNEKERWNDYFQMT